MGSRIIKIKKTGLDEKRCQFIKHFLLLTLFLVRTRNLWRLEWTYLLRITTKKAIFRYSLFFLFSSIIILNYCFAYQVFVIIWIILAFSFLAVERTWTFRWRKIIVVTIRAVSLRVLIFILFVTVTVKKPSHFKPLDSSKL